jgi:hypothetical protein
MSFSLNYALHTLYFIDVVHLNALLKIFFMRAVLTTNLENAAGLKLFFYEEK